MFSSLWRKFEGHVPGIYVCLCVHINMHACFLFVCVCARARVHVYICVGVIMMCGHNYNFKQTKSAVIFFKVFDCF